MKRLLLIAALPLMSACGTMRFDRYPSRADGTDRGITVSVGEVRNEMGFSDPSQVRFNVKMDRPVAEAVRQALILELKAAGYRIGDGGLAVTAAVRDMGYGRPMRMNMDLPRTEIAFSVQSGEREVFDGSYRSTRFVGSIYDSPAFFGSLQDCILQFLRDFSPVASLQQEP